MNTIERLSHAMKMADPGPWNVAPVCYYHEFSYFPEDSELYLENNDECSHGHPTEM